MNTNPESLKYTLGQKVFWKNENADTVDSGTVINVDYAGVDVTQGIEECWIPFDHILHTA